MRNSIRSMVFGWSFLLMTIATARDQTEAFREMFPYYGPSAFVELSALAPDGDWRVGRCETGNFVVIGNQPGHKAKISHGIKVEELFISDQSAVPFGGGSRAEHLRAYTDPLRGLNATFTAVIRVQEGAVVRDSAIMMPGTLAWSDDDLKRVLANKTGFGDVIANFNAVVGSNEADAYSGWRGVARTPGLGANLLVALLREAEDLRTALALGEMTSPESKVPKEALVAAVQKLDMAWSDARRKAVLGSVFAQHHMSSWGKLASGKDPYVLQKQERERADAVIRALLAAHPNGDGSALWAYATEVFEVAPAAESGPTPGKQP